MGLLENIRQALLSIRANLLRAVLTFMVIAVGIMALIGILTAIDSITASLSTNLASMGANSFNIAPKGTKRQGRRRGKREKPGPAIDFRQAVEFKENYSFPATVAISAMCNASSLVKTANKETNPNVILQGMDDNHLEIAGYDIEYGRNFTALEAINGRNIAIIGVDIVSKLFNKKPEKALGSVITISNVKYKVVGVLAEKGSSMTMSGDRIIFIPLQNAKRFYGQNIRSFSLSVAVKDAIDMDAAIADATGTLRRIRNLKASQEDDFEFSKSDGLASMLEDNTRTLRFAAMFIGFITLLGAAVGLMNIMLVSVTERTREIGISKALGATKNNILIQFLTETIVICQIGGLLGIFFGILMGNLVAGQASGVFIIPWAWIFFGITLCLFVGLGAGLYPAIKASRLDPIEALRYE